MPTGSDGTEAMRTVGRFAGAGRWTARADGFALSLWNAHASTATEKRSAPPISQRPEREICPSDPPRAVLPTTLLLVLGSDAERGKPRLDIHLVGCGRDG